MRVDGPVVAALDGGPHSACTLDWAVAEAVRRRTHLVLVSVVQDAWQATAWAWYPVVGASTADREVAELLDERVRYVEDRHPRLDVRARTLHGQLVPCLREVSAEAQLLVVGARERDGLARTGVTAGHVAAHARCPVVVVRDRPAGRAGDAPVIVGVDGSSSSMAAAHAAAREAWLRGRRLVVVHARPTVRNPFARGSLAPLATESPDDPTHKVARAVADSLRDEHEGLDVELVLVDDDPAAALVGLGRDAVLLVVGSRGLAGFRGMLLGSVSSAVVRDASGPVLVVHDGG